MAAEALDALFADRRLWRGHPTLRTPGREPSGHAELDAVLPEGGWPQAALTELLLPADGLGELRLLWPTLARHTRAGHAIALIAPPYLPYAPAWQAAGIDLRCLHVIATSPAQAPWAAEQCLRAGCLAAVLCWPSTADDRALRRLSVAADSGRTLGFVFRDARAARQPSPAALRLEFAPGRLQVLKCRGGNPPARPVAFAAVLH